LKNSVNGTGWRGLVIGLVAIAIAVSAFYWVLTFSPRQVTTTVTVLAPPLDGGGLGRVLDVCFSWSRRCDEIVARLIDSARNRVLVAAYSLKNRWVAEALIRAHRRGVEVKVVLDALQTHAGGSQYWNLWLSGIDVRAFWDARPMRYGFAVIDDDIVVAGSYGFSRAEEGYESVVILQGEAVRRYSEEFERLWVVTK
jgi:phosphatidylserine/phosphatidylglycerophosphate/cardiolipin synthase-like enzyme